MYGDVTVDGNITNSNLQGQLNLKADSNEVDAKIAKLVDSAPSTLDTLKELAQALNNDGNFSTSITNLIATKAPLNNPIFTGTVGGLSKDMVNLAKAENTRDLSKPISNATQTALSDLIGYLQTVHYNKDEINGLIADFFLNYYCKQDSDSSLALKANQSTTYTKTEVDDSLALKANQSTTYTKTVIEKNIIQSKLINYLH